MQASVHGFWGQQNVTLKQCLNIFLWNRPSEAMPRKISFYWLRFIEFCAPKPWHLGKILHFPNTLTPPNSCALRKMRHLSYAPGDKSFIDEKFCSICNDFYLFLFMKTNWNLPSKFFCLRFGLNVQDLIDMINSWPGV